VPFPQLPHGFRFGTVSSAYQDEGALEEDGRGRTSWDVFSAEPARIRDGSRAVVASDSYHRIEEDVALLRRLGVAEHRFAISWARIQPTGRGPANPRGLDHYDRLIDALLEAGIEPTATLYHYDLPQTLEDDGGWLNRSTVEAFAEYAAICATRFADRVRHWVPVQEPNAVAYLGYGTGVWAPGRQLLFDAFPAVHHLLLAHGRAAIELRRAGASSVGCANNHAPMWPFSEDPADVGACKMFDAMWNGLYLESMLLGRYPADMEPLLVELAGVRDGDMATIRQPLDFYGVNFHHPERVGAAAEDSPVPFAFYPLLGYPETDAAWPVVPSALREFLILLRARFRAALPPIVVTECGADYTVVPAADGSIEDHQRIEFLDAHLRAVQEAIARGVDVRGFQVMTLLDGWDWENGFTSQYGLVGVDRVTQERTPKRSFEWYAEAIAASRGSNPPAQEAS
jgi:beta-glucosidase